VIDSTKDRRVGLLEPQARPCLYSIPKLGGAYFVMH
jgi:hypothetical protein